MSTISSGTTLTTALVQTGDTTGDLVIKTGSSNTTAMTISGTDQSIVLAAPLPVASGGTGASNLSSITNSVLPSQSGNSGKYLTTDGANSSWATVTQTRISGGTTGLTPSTLTGGDVTLAGTLAVANGGTGSTTLTANNVLLGNGTSALQVVAPGTSGNVLTSNGTTWASSALSVSGTAKAWVNFNGSGGGIRASSNVSSISVNGTGRYTVNMSTAQTDANYARLVTASGLSGDGNGVCANTDVVSGNSVTATTTAFGILLTISGQSGYRDSPYVSAAVFR